MTVTRYQQKRGTSAQWAASVTPLRDGELGIDKDTGVIKVGDGFTLWADLPTAFSSQYLPVLGKANDSYRLEGLSASDFLKKTELTDFATSASVTTLNTQLTSLTAQTSATRKLVTNWGAMTSFPVNGALPGDTVVRSDLGTGGSAWLYVGPGKGSGGWVHKGILICTSTTRPTTVAYTGLQILETDTGFIMMHNGTVWRYAGPALFGNKIFTLGTTTPAISGSTLATAASITVPPNSRIRCEGKVQLNLANTNYQTMGWGKPWTVTSGSTVLYSTYEHMSNGTGSQQEFNLWSRALIDTGTNSTITITAQWTSGGGNNGMTLSQPEFFYQIGGTAP